MIDRDYWPPLSNVVYNRLKVLHIFLGPLGQEWMLETFLAQSPNLEKLYLLDRPTLDGQHPAHQSLRVLQIDMWDTERRIVATGVDHPLVLSNTMSILPNLTTLTIKYVPRTLWNPQPRFDLPNLLHLTVIETSLFPESYPIWDAFRAPSLTTLTLDSPNNQGDEGETPRTVAAINEFIIVSGGAHLVSIRLCSRSLPAEDEHILANTLSSLLALCSMQLHLSLKLCSWISSLLLGGLTDLYVNLEDCEGKELEGFRELVHVTTLVPKKAVTIVGRWGWLDD